MGMYLLTPCRWLYILFISVLVSYFMSVTCSYLPSCWSRRHGPGGGFRKASLLQENNGCRWGYYCSKNYIIPPILSVVVAGDRRGSLMCPRLGSSSRGRQRKLVVNAPPAYGLDEWGRRTLDETQRCIFGAACWAAGLNKQDIQINSRDVMTVAHAAVHAQFWLWARFTVSNDQMNTFQSGPSEFLHDVLLSLQMCEDSIFNPAAAKTQYYL